jgi:hypothetical protein
VSKGWRPLRQAPWADVSEEVVLCRSYWQWPGRTLCRWQHNCSRSTCLRQRKSPLILPEAVMTAGRKKKLHSSLIVVVLVVVELLLAASSAPLTSGCEGSPLR